MHCPKKAAQQQLGSSAPAKQNVSQPGAGNRVQTRYNHGRLNHLEAKAVQEPPGMIVGMFPVDSHIAEVLFDTGATHSFITASWVETHNVPIATMPTPIQIDVTEPPKLLGPPIDVLALRTSDNHVGARNHSTSSILCILITSPKSVSPITQILHHIGGKNKRKRITIA
jgi:hypothetical protein